MCEEKRRLIDLYAAALKASSDLWVSLTDSDWAQPTVKTTVQRLDTDSKEVDALLGNLRHHIETHGC